MHRERRQPFHAAIQRGRLQRLRQDVETGKGTNIKVAFAAAGGHRPHQRFTAQRDTVVPVCPAVRQHFVHPQLEQRRHAVPLHRMLPDDQIGTGQRRLLGSDIDIEIGVKLIERAYLDAVKRPCLLKHPLIRMRVLRIRVRINYEDH